VGHWESVGGTVGESVGSARKGSIGTGVGVFWGNRGCVGGVAPLVVVG